MKLTVEKLLVISGLGYLILAASYVLVFLANYDIHVDSELIRSIKNIALLKIGNADKFSPRLTWGLGAFWGMMFLVSLTLWNQNEKEKMQTFLTDEGIGVGVIPFLVALGYHFGLDYRNCFLLTISGIYAIVTIAIYFQERE